MSTAARVNTVKNGHWYAIDGTACYQVPKKDGTGMRNTTLADARKLNLVPSVTHILGILDKPALTAWKIEQACLAILTSPRLEGEKDDAFVTRVLKVEAVQEQEGQIARDRGTEIHDALESLSRGESVSPEILPWVEPAAEAIIRYGKPIAVEKILIGDGYGGRTDLITEAPDCHWIIDYKSTKKLPEKGAWPEHVTQCSAYAAAHKATNLIRTANVYISTIEQGKFVICEHKDWRLPFEGFKCLVRYWQIKNEYYPAQ